MTLGLVGNGRSLERTNSRANLSGFPRTWGDLPGWIAVIGLAGSAVAGPLYEGGPQTLAVHQVWQDELPNLSGVSTAIAMCPGPGGRIHVTGSAGTAVYEADGTLVWTATICGVDLVADTEGGTTVVGNSGTVAFAAAGAVVWSDPVAALAVGRDFDGRVMVLSAESLTWFGDAGERVRTRELPEINGWPVLGRLMKVDFGGRPVVVGTSKNDLFGTESLVVLRYNSAGNLDWVTSPDGFLNAEDVVGSTPTALVTDSAGNILVAGRSAGHSGQEAYLLKLWEGGRPAWRRVIPHTAEPRLAVDSRGFIWVGAGNGILKYEPDRGDPVWMTRLGLPSGHPLALVTDGANNCYVAEEGVRMTKFDLNGNLHWTDRVTNAPGLGTPPVAALCVSTNGLVVGSWGLWQGGTAVVAAQEANVAGLPEITLQPSPDVLHVAVSNAVSYTVGAAGAEPLHFQWKIAGPEWAPWLATATNATCYPDTSRRSSNVIAVMIWNDVGYILSRPVTLAVSSPPQGAIHTPLGIGSADTSTGSRLADSLFSTVSGATHILLAPGAHFPIQAENRAETTFQWFFNGTPIAGATNHYLILPDMTEDQGGMYGLQMENPYGGHFTEAQVRVASNVRQEFVQHLEHPDWANPGRRIVTDAVGDYYVSSLTNALELGKLDWIVSKYHRFGFLLRTVHVAKLDRDGSSYYRDFATTGDGRLAAVYSEAGTNSAYRCGTRQYDPDGILVWEAGYSDTNGFACEPRELRIDPLGNSYVRIEVRSSPGSQVLAKYDRTGGLVYAGSFDLPFSETGELLAVDAQGQAVLATRGGLYRLGPTGEVLWRSDRNACVCAKTDPAGHVFVSDWGNRVIAKLDAQGQVLWTSGEYGYLEPDRAGNLYAWELQSPEFRTYRLLKLDGTTGRVLWGRSGFDEAGNPPRQLALDTADNLYLLSSHPLANGVSWLCKMDSQGNLLWSATYGLDGNCRFESAQLCLGAAGDLHVVGMSDGNSAPGGSCPEGWILVKYSQADDDSAPGIVANPIDQMVLPGEAVTFTVSAVGAPDLRYQWWQATSLDWIGTWPPLPLLAFPLHGLVLRGETNATLTVTNAGIYFVEVSNPLGVTSSRGVSLSHEPPPWLSAQSLAGGQYRFELYGPPDRAYEIQQSPNLQDWSHFTDLVLTNGWIQVTNAVDPGSPARFFRAVRPPR